MGLILLVGLIVVTASSCSVTTRLECRRKASLGVAIREAARVRLRPILMTTLCTLFGLLPLALGIRAGSELQRPLALAVIGDSCCCPHRLRCSPFDTAPGSGADYPVATILRVRWSQRAT
jgi:Cu/Ag efflux pump CusA